MSRLSNPKECEFSTWLIFFGRTKGSRKVGKQNVEDNKVESVHNEPTDKCRPKSVFLPRSQPGGNESSSFCLAIAHGETGVVKLGLHRMNRSGATGSTPFMISQ